MLISFNCKSGPLPAYIAKHLGSFLYDLLWLTNKLNDIKDRQIPAPLNTVQVV